MSPTKGTAHNVKREYRVIRNSVYYCNADHEANLKYLAYETMILLSNISASVTVKHRLRDTTVGLESNVSTTTKEIK